jgi:hypothetical protein
MEVLAVFLRENLGLELSPQKTKITATAEGFNFFLGHPGRLVRGLDAEEVSEGHQRVPGARADRGLVAAVEHLLAASVSE